MLSIFHIYLTTCCWCHKTMWLMTWVATSWNVRCDNVVNISHIFDDMLLMSQNDMIMAWMAACKMTDVIIFQYLTSIWQHVVDWILSKFHIYLTTCFLCHKTMWISSELQHCEMSDVRLLSISHIYSTACDYCLACIFVRCQNIVNISHLFDDMLLMS